MKKIVLYFILLLLFTWLGLFISKDSGYVLIAYGNTTIETTLWIGIVVLFLFFLLLYFLTRLDIGLQNLPTIIKKWRLNKNKIKAERLLQKGILATISGEWKKAEKNLCRALKLQSSNSPLINYLACANLADKQGNHEKCDNYLSMAFISNKKTAMEVELLRAQFQVKNQHWQEALSTLTQLRKTNSNNKILLNLLHKTYLNLKEWHNLQLLIPLLRRHKILSPVELNNVEKTAYKELLHENIVDNTPDKTMQLWHKMPRSLHRDAEMLVIYIVFLREHGLHDKAEKILFKFLPQIWSDKLIEQYGTFVSTKPLKQLKLAEKWLQNHNQDATLLLCLGRICKQQKLWGKAKNYLEQSLEISPTATTYYELGQIMEMQNDKIAALNYYRNGLRFTNGS